MPKKKTEPKEKEKEKEKEIEKKGKGKTSPKRKQKEPEEEEEEEDDQDDDLEKYRVPGERMTEITAEDLKAWPKTKNCKFFVAVEHKTVEYELANGEADKVCTFYFH